jgi:co-chaperonin GroES (HSP10)
MSINVVKGKLIPIRDNVLITDMSFEEKKTASGIIIQSDDGKSEGIRPRWGRVWAVGPEQTEVEVGQWILVEHGRWTRGVKVQDDNGDEIIIRRVETKSIMMSSDDRPPDDMFGGAHSSTTQGQTFNPEMFLGPQY